MKTVRAIIEYNNTFGEYDSERNLVRELRTAIGTMFETSGRFKVKGFNVTMARERKRGKTEKKRFQAGK
jgi:hypothetical protein